MFVRVFVVVELQHLEHRRGRACSHHLHSAVHLRVERDHDLQGPRMVDVRQDDVHDAGDDTEVGIVVLRALIFIHIVVRLRELLVLIVRRSVHRERERRGRGTSKVSQRAFIRG